MLAEVLTAFAHRAPDRAPIVIVTADHGEALGEHGQPFHSTDLYDSQIRVPLVIAGPGIKPQHVTETVSLDRPRRRPCSSSPASSPPARRSLDGRSIADLATGARAGDPDGGIAFAAMIKDRSNPGGVTAIVRGRWKLIDSNGQPRALRHARRSRRARQRARPAPAGAAELRRLLDARIAAGEASPFD